MADAGEVSVISQSPDAVRETINSELVLPVTHPASQPFIQASRHQAASKLEGSAINYI